MVPFQIQTRLGRGFNKSTSTQTLATLEWDNVVVDASNLRGSPNNFAIENKDPLLNKCTGRFGKQMQTGTIDDSDCAEKLGDHLKTLIVHPWKDQRPCNIFNLELLKHFDFKGLLTKKKPSIHKF